MRFDLQQKILAASSSCVPRNRMAYYAMVWSLTQTFLVPQFSYALLQDCPQFDESLKGCTKFSIWRANKIWRSPSCIHNAHSVLEPLLQLNWSITLISSTIMHSQVSHSRREGVCREEGYWGVCISHVDHRDLQFPSFAKKAMEGGKKEDLSWNQTICYCIV